MGNDVKIEPGSMWFRADDFNAKVNILTADDDVIRYQYLKMNDNGSASLGRANRDQFLKIFIKWDEELERFKPGSIWEAVQGCGQASKGKKIKITCIFGNIVEWTFLDNFEKTKDHCTCKSSFLYCFTRIADNDNGAIYCSIEPPIGMVKVKNTKPTFSISPLTVQAFTSVEYTEIKPQENCKTFITNGKDFHSEFELFSLNPAEEFCVDTNDPNYSRKLIDQNKGESEMEILKETEENKVVVGSIWKSKTSNEYVRIEITTGELIHFRPLTNKKSSRDIESMCRKRFLEDFKFEKDDDILALYVSDGDENKLAIITDYGSYPERVVCKFINMEKREVHTRVIGFIQFYHRYHLLSLDSLHEYRILHDSIEDIEKENKEKMEAKIESNKRETYLNTDESKMKPFDTGAKREDKSGKGRYDLIPGDIMADLVKYAWVAYFIEGPATICDTDISLNAYFDDVSNEKMFFEFILSMTCLFFTDHEKLDETTDSFGERSYVVTWENFHDALYKMRELLAKHYEVGAKVHGVNNWKKGIPVSDSERGGNFVDSMRRHTDQALRGLDDEPHAISAIWNAFCAIWTIRNKHTSTTNTSETKPEAEIKSNDCETDKAPDKIADAPTVSYSVLVANVNNCVELLSKMLDTNKTTDLEFEIHDAYVDLYMLCVLLKSVLKWFHDNDKARVCIEHIISGIYDLINTNIQPVRSIFDNVKAEWVEGYDEIYAVCLGKPDKYKILCITNICCRIGSKLINNDHFCGRQMSNGVLFELKDHLDKLIKE